MDKPNFIEVYTNVFSDEYCNSVIEFFKIAEKNNILVDRQKNEGASKLNKEDLAIFLPSMPLQQTTQPIFD
jgi:hypothetical protein